MTAIISDTNPNQDRGGTGCLYSGEQKDFDCAGRYVTFPKVKVFSPLNPIATICEYHLRAVVAKLDDPKTESARVSYDRAKPVVEASMGEIDVEPVPPRGEELSL